ncbi:MAG: hypothetical protein AAB848_00665, partial [Patescibacteria group bacterium]
VINVVRQYQAKRLNIVEGEAIIQPPVQNVMQANTAQTKKPPTQIQSPVALAQATLQTNAQSLVMPAQVEKPPTKRRIEKTKKFEPKIPEPEIQPDTQKNEESKLPSEITYKFED